MTFETKPLNAIGLEVVGLNLDALDDNTGAQLRALWIEHGVLLFRGIGTDAARHIALSKVFGPVEQHVIAELRLQDQPDLIALGGEGEKKGSPLIVDGELRGGFLFLHQDGAYTPSISQGGMLRMVKPPRNGGDTLWTDTQAAYDALPVDLRDFCDNHSTVQIWRDYPETLWGWPDIKLENPDKTRNPTFGLGEQKFPPVLQPMVIAHPETNRKSLLLSPLGYAGIWGMSRREADPVYEMIVRHAASQRFCYRHHWGANDLVLWDNRRTMHAAFGYPYDETRIVQRTTLAGAQPTGRLLSDVEIAMLD
jgi:Probable taurine catabolism dioxygenase